MTDPKENRPGTGGSQNSSSGTDSTGPNLPEEFWKRESLQHIRQAAHSRGRSADVVFGVTLARLSAMIPHTMRFDSGIGRGSLNMFVAMIGNTSAGKSTGNAVVTDLLTRPAYLTDDNFRDGLPLGSGEGMAEAFYGWVNQEREVGPGKTRTIKVREQVRHNVFFYVDEGQSLTQTIERAGAIIGPTIRSAWNGELLGQSNAREDTTRILHRETYSLGMVIGFQKSTAQPLLADSGPGTPQRFLWLSAVDQTIPDVRMNWPGPLTINLDSPEKWMVSGAARPRPDTTIEFAEPIRDELWRGNLARARGHLTPPELDAHEPLMRCKVAALLAVLDQRFHVTEEDWDLSLMVWDTSRAVRDDVIRWGQEQAQMQAHARNMAAATRETAIRDHVRDTAGKDVQRVAALLRDYLKKADGQTKGGLRRRLNDRDRLIFPKALDYAVEMEAIRVMSDKKTCRLVPDMPD